MRRLYYLASDLHVCTLVARQLAEEGIADRNFHVLSRDQMGLYQHRIHAATAYQQLDVVRAAQRWGLVGIAAGLLVGVLAYLTQPFPWQVNGSAVAMLALVVGLIAALQGALLGLSRESYKIGPFHDDLEAGRHLLMVDVGDHKRVRLREIMTVRFPSIEYRGCGSVVIGPFADHLLPAPGSAGR